MFNTVPHETDILLILFYNVLVGIVAEKLLFFILFGLIGHNCMQYRTCYTEQGLLMI
jgi:hypothetical protein